MERGFHNPVFTLQQNLQFTGVPGLHSPSALEGSGRFVGALSSCILPPAPASLGTCCWATSGPGHRGTVGGRTSVAG